MYKLNVSVCLPEAAKMKNIYTSLIVLQGLRSQYRTINYINLSMSALGIYEGWSMRA